MSRATEDVFGVVLQGFERDVLPEADARIIEDEVSALIGAWWPGHEVTMGDELAAYCQNRGTTTGLVLLTALQRLATSEDQRATAGEGAAALAASGVIAPPWAGAIGDVAVETCWVSRDVYGDQATVMCVFATPDGDRHALLALIGVDGRMDDVLVSDQPDEVLRDLRKDVLGSDGVLVLREVDAAEARGLIEEGFALTDEMWEADDEEPPTTFRTFRALALARCRAMPEPPPTEPVEISDEERAAIITAFLTSPEAEEAELPVLPEPGQQPSELAKATAYCARLLVAFGSDYDRGRPVRVSPVKTEVFLRHWLPRAARLDDLDRAVLPDVVVAWVRWAAAYNELPATAVAEVVAAAEECVATLDEDLGSGAALFRAGLPADLDDEELADTLARRRFAIPELSTVVSGEEYRDLDPTEADDRRILIVGEHPEYHEALDDPDFAGEIDGVDPAAHISLHEVIANQLWDNEPPELWPAAQRLLEEGMRRHDVQHVLMGLAAQQLWKAMQDEEVDPAEYVAALKALG